MYKIIYPVLLIIYIVILLVDLVYLIKILSRMKHESDCINTHEYHVNRLAMSRPEFSTLVESYKEGYRYVVKDAHERKLIFFKEEPIKCGAAWLTNASDKLKYVDYWDNKDSLNKDPKYSSDLFLMVFDFIDEKSEKPYLIENLLEELLKSWK